MSEEEIPSTPYIHVDEMVSRIISCYDHIQINCKNERILFYPSDRKVVRMQGEEIKEVVYLRNKE